MQSAYINTIGKFLPEPIPLMGKSDNLLVNRDECITLWLDVLKD